MKRWVIPIINIVLPALLFYVLYRTAGILPSIFISAGYSLIVLVRQKAKTGSVKNTQILGLVSLLASGPAIYFSGEEKFYYIPSLVTNVVLLIFMLLLSGRGKSVLHFLAKDFEIRSLSRIPEKNMLRINLVWIVYYALKIIAKLLGLLYLDFQKLYWLVFLLGDPMTLLAILLSVFLIRRQPIPERERE